MVGIRAQLYVCACVYVYGQCLSRSHEKSYVEQKMKAVCWRPALPKT